MDDRLVRNLKDAYKVTDAFAAAHPTLDLWDVRDVTTLMLVTESGGGWIYANNGQGYQEPDTVANRTPWNWDSDKNQPKGTPESRAAMRAILRKSMDSKWLAQHGIHYDQVGSNGRSTGPAQQLSVDTGGGWGPMQNTMSMTDIEGKPGAISMFLAAVQWTNRDPWYPKADSPSAKRMANWQTAVVLRVQRPLASEVETNYGAEQLARAQAIARDPRFAPGTTEGDWFVANNWDDALNELRVELKPLKDDVAQIKTWIRGGVQGDANDASNIGEIWHFLNDTVSPMVTSTDSKIDQLTKWIHGGYTGDDSHKSNVGGIWYMVNRLAGKLLPEVKRPDLPDADQPVEEKQP